MTPIRADAKYYIKDLPLFKRLLREGDNSSYAYLEYRFAKPAFNYIDYLILIHCDNCPGDMYFELEIYSSNPLYAKKSWNGYVLELFTKEIFKSLALIKDTKRMSSAKLYTYIRSGGPINA